MSKDPGLNVMQRIEALARISEEPGRLTRTFCSPAMRHANDLVGEWMRQAGMSVRVDAIGNLIGHFPATVPNSSRHFPRPKPRLLRLKRLRSSQVKRPRPGLKRQHHRP